MTRTDEDAASRSSADRPRRSRASERGAWHSLADRTWIATAAELGPRAARHSRDDLDKRLRRLGDRSYFIVQCAISAGVAWFIAGGLLGHPQPFFAPISALIALGQSYGQRLERVLQVIAGVAVGVFIGDTFVAIFGSGFWQLAVVIIVAMGATTLLGAGVLMTTQAGVQSALVTMVVAPPGMAFSRWIDALVGGLVALAAASITPASPLRRPRQHAATIVDEIAGVLDATVDSLRSRNLTQAEATLERARRSEAALEKLQELADDGLAVVRVSPFRRGDLPGIQAIADLLVPLDRAIRNIRVLVRRATIAIREGESVPKAYVDMIADLARATHAMSADLRERRLPTGVRPDLRDLGELTTYVSSRPSLSSEVIRAQVRSTICDLLMVTGMEHEEALAYIPSSYDLEHESGHTAQAPGDVPTERLTRQTCRDDRADDRADDRGDGRPQGADAVSP